VLDRLFPGQSAPVLSLEVAQLLLGQLIKTPVAPETLPDILAKALTFPPVPHDGIPVPDIQWRITTIPYIIHCMSVAQRPELFKKMVDVSTLPALDNPQRATVLALRQAALITLCKTQIDAEKLGYWEHLMLSNAPDIVPNDLREIAFYVLARNMSVELRRDCLGPVTNIETLPVNKIAAGLRGGAAVALLREIPPSCALKLLSDAKDWTTLPLTHAEQRRAIRWRGGLIFAAYRVLNNADTEFIMREKSDLMKPDTLPADPQDRVKDLGVRAGALEALFEEMSTLEFQAELGRLLAAPTDGLCPDALVLRELALNCAGLLLGPGKAHMVAQLSIKPFHWRR